MAIYDSILFIEIFLLICLILILIILYNYLTKYRDKVGELLFDYIIYPFFTLLLIGILLHIYDFKYITQYITVCGPILSACVAIYVSSRNENIQKNKEVSKKLDYFEFNIEILDICNKAIKQELKNYETLTSIFKKPNLELPTLTSTPFDF
ncbi:MAG: hypothetical protein IPI90_07740 [Saprospiraceae bacterium]|nr:hypothetical protein [Candidatus Vicinibacter affinis]